MPAPRKPERAGWLIPAAAGLCLVFAFYGSWVPLRFHYLPLGEAWRQFAALPFFDQTIVSRTDWATNFLLLIPFTFLCAQWLTPNAPGVLRPLLRIFIVGLGALVACTLEFSQLYFPPRTVSQQDILAQTVGSAVGVLLQIPWGNAVEDWLTMFWQAERRQARVARLLHAYLAVLLVFNMLPLDLTVSAVELYHKWREGRVVLIPFAGLKGGVFDALYEISTDIAVWAPVGLFWAITRRSGPAAAALAGALLAAAIEGAQLFVYSRVTDVTDILLAGVGAGLGGMFAPAARWRGAFAWAGIPTGFWRALWALWAVAALAAFWFPFDFSLAGATPGAIWADLAHAPFEKLHEGSEYHAVNEVLRKAGLFLPGGILWGLALAAGRGGAGRPAARWGGFAALVLMAILVEAGQLFLPSHIADFTDVLLEAGGGALGLWLALWVMAGESGEMGAPPQSAPPPRPRTFAPGEDDYRRAPGEAGYRRAPAPIEADRRYAPAPGEDEDEDDYRDAPAPGEARRYAPAPSEADHYDAPAPGEADYRQALAPREVRRYAPAPDEPDYRQAPRPREAAPRRAPPPGEADYRRAPGESHRRAAHTPAGAALVWMRAAVFLVPFVGLFVVTRLPFAPYNLRELGGSGIGGFFSTLFLAAAVYWIAAGPFLLFGPDGARMRRLPLWLPAHALVGWILLRLGAPMESLHDIVGSPVLGWPWEFEMIGRYVALHSALMLAAAGAVLLVEIRHRANGAALLVWFAACLLLAAPLHWVVVVRAATDNLTELIRGGGGLAGCLLLGAGVFAFFVSAAALAALLAGRGGVGVGLVALAIVSAVAATVAFWFGSERAILKYGRVFSAWQFLLSTDRQHYASAVQLWPRYAFAYTAAMMAFGLMQFPWFRVPPRIDRRRSSQHAGNNRFQHGDHGGHGEHGEKPVKSREAHGDYGLPARGAQAGEKTVKNREAHGGQDARRRRG
ncbi:MAG: VanZ family protein [Candidatus Accumulibacter sp.]|jgi:VanZ family protein|nr:VanZ family protein [Accumulibacter sp.]